MLSVKEKRQRLISESRALFTQRDPKWFRHVHAKISKLIQGKSQDERTEIILKWIRECEEMACETCKKKIIKLFAQ
jgi:hypothetical protein